MIKRLIWPNETSSGINLRSTFWQAWQALRAAECAASAAKMTGSRRARSANGCLLISIKLAIRCRSAPSRHLVDAEVEHVTCQNKPPLCLFHDTSEPRAALSLRTRLIRLSRIGWRARCARTGRYGPGELPNGFHREAADQHVPVQIQQPDFSRITITSAPDQQLVGAELST